MGQNLRAEILWAKILRAEISWAEISWAKILRAKFLHTKNMEIFPTQKICKQKSPEMIQVNVPNFFYFAEIPKLTEISPKNRFFYNKKKFHPSQTLCKQKSSEMIQVNVPIFFILPKSQN